MKPAKLSDFETWSYLIAQPPYRERDDIDGALVVVGSNQRDRSYQIELRQVRTPKFVINRCGSPVAVVAD